MAPGTRLGPYELVARIGAGGMGEVWRARDTRLGRDIAIKVLPAQFAGNPERRRRFEQEARAVAALSHPNILAIFDVGNQDGIPYLVTELLEGESLRDRLRTGGLPIRKTVEIAVQVAQGLSAAHDKGIVHRDLKPENLFVTNDGTVKLLDFGVAALRVEHEPAAPPSEATTRAELTGTGVALGTAGYMAPEQVRGLKVDQHADIFAFGCVLYEMLSGRRAFQGDTTADTMSAILREDPPPLGSLRQGVSPHLVQIVNHCLEKRAEDRFASARDVAMALRVVSESGVAAPAVASPPQRRRLLLGGSIAVGVAAVAVLAIWRPWQGLLAHGGSTTERVPSIVALPCKVYGAPEVAFLTDAVPQTISTFLGQVNGIDTKVPPSSLEAEKVGGDLGRIAELYGVSSLVVTSATESMGTFTLNVQLVDAPTRSVTWSRQVEGSLETFNDLARQAAEGVRQAVLPSAPPIPAGDRSSVSELALREGDYFLRRYSDLNRPPDLKASELAFERALTADPSLAAAAAGLSSLYVLKHHTESEPEGSLREAEAWARRALELDRRCGRAWSTLSMLENYSATPNIDRQVECALKAAVHAPRDADGHMALSATLGAPGAQSLSLAAALQGAEVDPFFLPLVGNVAMVMTLLGRAEEGMPYADRIHLVEPQGWLSPVVRTYVLARLGRFDEAHQAASPWEPIFFRDPSSDVNQMFGQVRFYLAAAEGDTAMIAEVGARILPSLLEGRADSITFGNAIAFVCPALARLGRTDDAVRILLHGVTMGISPAYDWLLFDPDIQLLRSDPRFAQVLAASRYGSARIARILEGARGRGELPAYLEQPLAELQHLLATTPA